MSQIILENITKRYPTRTVLREFTLKVKRGERVVILGPSGSGKTTLLRLLAGFIAPDTGRIFLEGTIVAENGRILVEPEKRHIGMVFQDLALWPHMTVWENLAFGLKARGIPAAERKRRIREMLKTVRLEDYSRVRPGSLSGGQQQRVALARALVLRPTVLLMDEPLSSLDPELNLKLRREILELHEKSGFTLLYVTHHQGEARDIGTRLVYLRQENAW